MSDEPSRGDVDQDEPELILSVPARLKRTGKELRIVIDGAARPAMVDSGLVRLIGRAHAIRTKIVQDGSVNLAEIARQERLAASYVTRLIRLTWLAPRVAPPDAIRVHRDRDVGSNRPNPRPYVGASRPRSPAAA